MENDRVLDFGYHQDPLTVSTEGLGPMKCHPQANPTESFRLTFPRNLPN